MSGATINYPPTRAKELGASSSNIKGCRDCVQFFYHLQPQKTVPSAEQRHLLVRQARESNIGTVFDLSSLPFPDLVLKSMTDDPR